MNIRSTWYIHGIRIFSHVEYIVDLLFFFFFNFFCSLFAPFIPLRFNSLHYDNHNLSEKKKSGKKRMKLNKKKSCSSTICIRKIYLVTNYLVRPISCAFIRWYKQLLRVNKNYLFHILIIFFSTFCFAFHGNMQYHTKIMIKLS